jgi:hypothetical protein
MYEVQQKVLRLAADALVPHMQTRSLAIVGMMDGKPNGVGSGTCIRIDDRYFIATCAHVIAPYETRNLRLIHSLEPSVTEFNILRTGLRGGVAGDIDVAWLELDPRDLATLGKQFIDHRRVRPHTPHLPDDLAVLFGFPGKLLSPEKTPDGELIGLGARPIAYHTGTLAPDQYPNSDPPPDLEVDMFLDYPSDGNILTSGSSAELPPAPGLSGGGIWSSGVTTEGIWSPEGAALIGIEKSWPGKHVYVRGTQIQHWFRMLAEDLPELEPIVRHLT